MPAISSGRENVNSGRAKPAAKRRPAGQRTGAFGRGADTIPVSKPSPTRPTGVFKPGAPRPATAPLTVDAPRVAQQKVDRARRKLPPVTVAAPPVVSAPKAKPAAKAPPLTQAQVESFLRSQSKVTQHAREQIVGSIRKNLGNTRGRERQEMTARILREIATDPRHSATRKAIVHYTGLEREQSGPQTRSRATAGPKPRKAKIGVGPLTASINLTATGTAITEAAEKVAPGLASAGASAEGKFAKNALSDLAHLPLMGPQTAYEVAMAAKEAAGGDTKRAKELAKSFTEGVYGHVARGDWQGLEDYFREHPVFALLEIRGGKGVLGRGAGATMRSGVLGEGAKKAASTARRDLDLSGEGARVADRQHYSPDVITKAIQVMAERKRQGKPRLGDHRLRRRADFESDMAAGTARAVRSDEARQAKDAKPDGPLAEVVGLAVQGVIRPQSLEADLRKELARLDNAHATAEFSTGAQKRQNRTTADAIRSVLENPAAMARIGDVAQSGRANVRAINDLEQRAKDLNAIDPKRADRAKLFPAAQAHLDAEYSDAPFRASRAREVAAGRAVRAATHGVEVARRDLARAVANARVSQTRHKTSPALQAAQRGLRDAHAALRQAKTAQHENRRQVARQLVRAERGAREAARGFLRRDPDYVKFEAELAKANTAKQKLRQEIREARGAGKSTAKLEAALAQASTASRSAQGRVAAHAKKLMAEPVAKTATRGKRKGRKVPTARAAVLRAERAMLSPKATMTKPAQTVARSREEIRQAEAQVAREQRQIRGVAPAEADALRRALEERDAAPIRARDARAAFEAIRAERQAAARGGTSSLHVRDAAGNPVRLTNDEIQAVVGEDVAHLPHHTQQRGARAFYQTAFAGRKNLDSGKKRTGSAFEKGAVDSSYQAVTEHRVRMRGVVNRIAEHDRIIHSIAITGPKTPQNPHGMFTWDQAEKLASNAADNGAKLVPYRAVPGSYDRDRIARIAGQQDAGDTPDLEKLVEHEFAERLKAPAENDRTTPNTVLVPEQIVNQLKAQQAVSSSSLSKVGNVAADVFRRTILPFSAKWLLGNVVEAGIRLGAVGAGPNAYRIGRKLLAEMDSIDREQAIRVRAALTGGLLYGNRGLTVRRVSEHFEGTALATPAKAVTVAGQLPVVKQLGHLIKGYTDGVFALNRWMESAGQTAALGKHAKREIHELTGSWAKATRAQEAALRDVANGLLDSKNVHDAARYIDQTLGQYSRFSPGMRRFVQTYTPFLPWYLNSARWLLYTLPAKHPIKTGLYALVAQNLQDDFDASHKGLPPGDLRGAIVTDSGKVLPYAGLTPFGAFGSIAGGGNEQLTSLVDPFFPAFKSAALAAFGLNFSGHRAKIAPQDRRAGQEVPGAVRATMALNSLLEAFVPVVGIAKRVREGGSTGWDNSNVFSPKTKPGTRVPGGAANRILNPLRSSPIKGTARTAVDTSASTTPPQDEIDAALDAASAAFDDGALDDIDDALDVIP